MIHYQGRSWSGLSTPVTLNKRLIDNAGTVEQTRIIAPLYAFASPNLLQGRIIINRLQEVSRPRDDLFVRLSVSRRLKLAFG